MYLYAIMSFYIYWKFKSLMQAVAILFWGMYLKSRVGSWAKID